MKAYGAVNQNLRGFNLKMSPLQLGFERLEYISSN